MPFQAMRYSSRRGWGGSAAEAAEAHSRASKALVSAARRTAARQCANASGVVLFVRLGGGIGVLVAALVLEGLPKIADPLAERRPDLRQFAGAEDEQRHDQDHDELSSSHTEHEKSSIATVARGLVVLEGNRGPRRVLSAYSPARAPARLKLTGRGARAGAGARVV